jgi:hypothetical protein
MGAASIAVVAAAGILRIPGAPARAAITGLAVALWSIATVLIPPLATATAARYLRRPVRPRYRSDMWTVVFPLGMYAMSGLQLGTAAGLPLVGHIGRGGGPVRHGCVGTDLHRPGHLAARSQARQQGPLRNHVVLRYKET